MLLRLLSAVLTIVLLSSTAFASSPPPSPASQALRFPAPPVRAWAATVVDADTGQVLLAVNPHAHLAIASTTKVMTAVLALEIGKLTDRISVPANAFDFEWDATVMGLKPGEKVTLRDLLYGLMLPSGADAANTIAIHYAGSEARWVALMNQKAAALGMHDTHYATAHGLDMPGQYSSAYDLARLGVYASTIPDLVKIASTRSYTWNGHTFDNLNHVINWYRGAEGLKPGFTNAAGMCQLLAATRHGRHVVAAILHTPDMVIDARNLLNYGLSDFTWAQTSLPGDNPSLVQTGTDAGGVYVYFPATGHYVRGAFWKAFVGYGSSTALGFPRTEPIRDGKTLVQYFQNGVLSQDSKGRITRLALATSPVPPPTATPLPTATPHEGSINLNATSTPTRARATSTPAPRVTPTPAPPLTIDRVFGTYGKTHAKQLGSVIAPSWKSGDYTVQMFRYGALVFSTKARITWLLPLEDHLLKAEHYLPTYPGTAYPPSFAPGTVLKALHWV